MSGDAPRATLSLTPAWQGVLGDAAAKLLPRCRDPPKPLDVDDCAHSVPCTGGPAGLQNRPEIYPPAPPMRRDAGQSEMQPDMLMGVSERKHPEGE